MKRNRVAVFAVAVLVSVLAQPIALSQAGAANHGGHKKIEISNPTTKRSIASFNEGSVAAGLGAVTYQPGGTIISEPNMYVIWYGNWDANSCTQETGSSTPAIVNDFLGSLAESDWNKINTTYYQIINGKKTFVQPSGEVQGCAVDAGSQGLSLDGDTGPQVADVVDNALTTKTLKTDPNGVYIVLTASNVTVASFPATFCAYHFFYDTPQTTIKYAFIGDASPNLASCTPAVQVTNSPNNNPVADSMVSAIAHEFVEAVSDPMGLSWVDQAGYENADKCAWTYGSAFKTANGSFANMTLGDRQYLVQANVAANTNTCILSLKPNESDHHSPSHK